MRQCIFWMEWKEEKKFNREHIILEALGGKGDKDMSERHPVPVPFLPGTGTGCTQVVFANESIIIRTLFEQLA